MTVPTPPTPVEPVATETGWKITPAVVAKFITAVLGAAAIGVTQGLIEGTAAKWVAVIIAVATAAGVYIVPNKTG